MVTPLRVRCFPYVTAFARLRLWEHGSRSHAIHRDCPNADLGILLGVTDTEFHHPVFPTVTRVNVASMTTGLNPDGKQLRAPRLRPRKVLEAGTLWDAG